MRNLFSRYYPNFIYVDRYKFPKTWEFHLSRAPYSIVRFMIEGSGSYIINNVEYKVDKNEIVYIPLQVLHQAMFLI